MHVKDAHFDCPWTDAEDAGMLKGVFKYGTGNWEAIRIDPELNLSQVMDVILVNCKTNCQKFPECCSVFIDLI